jgi:tetratricopeptide (TPR) repeat protein
MLKKILLGFICLFILNNGFANTNVLDPNSKKITIYWDSSLSMKYKDLAKEIEFLDNYFNNIRDVDVELISFSNTIGIEKSFRIINSDWSSLKEILLGITYDGLAFFGYIDFESGSDINLLFTDGNEVIDKLNIKTETPTYIINSSNDANDIFLKAKSFNANGNYINLNEIGIKKGLTLLDMDGSEIVLIDKDKVKNEKSNINDDISGNENNLVSGVVYNAEGILSGAAIKIKDKSTGTTTDENGRFSINAKKGDVLEISYLGMKTKEFFVEKLKDNDILLLDENNLDEVVVTGSVKEEKVISGYGKVDKDKLGYSVKTVGEDELTRTDASNISDAARGKMGSALFGQNEDISQAVFRPGNSLGFGNQYPLIVIDGTPYRNNSTNGATFKGIDFIDPSNVASVTVLKGLAATNRWGSEGAAGVIVIKTKNAIGGKQSKKPYDRALLRDNDYNENLSLVNTSINEKYIDDLKKQNDITEKYDFYLNQRNKYLDDFQYFTNVSDYFAQLGYKDLSSKILSNILEIISNEIITLRFVAYKAEEKKDFRLAEIVYKRIAELKPKEAQSYRDLALIYQETGNYKKALNIYLNIQNDKFIGVNFSGLRKNINNEMRSLILHHKKDLNLTGVSSDYLSPMNYDARIVFDWNDRDADFEFQFVNPQKKFFTWSHTKENNASRIYNEKNQGFNSEEFLLISAEKGVWLINIESNIKNKKNPVVVKYTVFKNFGKPNETKETKLLILNNIKGKKMLGKVII